MNRRNYLKTISGSITGAIMIGSHPSIKPNYKITDLIIDVSVFFDKSFVELRNINKYTEPITFALKNSVKNIPNQNQNITVNVQISDYHPKIPTPNTMGQRTYDSIDNRVKTQQRIDAKDTLSWWNKQINEEKATTDISKDSNILITGHNISKYSGYANRPTTCENNASNNSAIVNLFDEKFLNYDEKRKINTDYEYLNTIIHEFGHNIGLTHQMGEVVDSKQGIVTPMLGRYAKRGNYVGENEFGAKIPKPKNISDDIKITKEFNNSISLSDLFTYCNCEKHN